MRECERILVRMLSTFMMCV